MNLLLFTWESEVDSISPKTGRPTKGETSRNVKLTIQLAEAENAMLKQCAEQKKVTRTDVIVEGIKLVKARMDEEKK